MRKSVCGFSSTLTSPISNTAGDMGNGGEGGRDRGEEGGEGGGGDGRLSRLPPGSADHESASGAETRPMTPAGPSLPPSHPPRRASSLRYCRVREKKNRRVVPPLSPPGSFNLLQVSTASSPSRPGDAGFNHDTTRGCQDRRGCRRGGGSLRSPPGGKGTPHWPPSPRTRLHAASDR